MLTENTPMTMTGDVYDAAGQKTNVTEFTVPIHSVQYSIKINEDGKANVGSAALTDELSVSGTISDQFSFTGYAALKVYDGRQDLERSDGDDLVQTAGRPAEFSV